jgi:hypothetical protein
LNFKSCEVKRESGFPVVSFSRTFLICLVFAPERQVLAKIVPRKLYTEVPGMMMRQAGNNMIRSVLKAGRTGSYAMNGSRVGSVVPGPRAPVMHNGMKYMSSLPSSSPQLDETKVVAPSYGPVDRLLKLSKLFYDEDEQKKFWKFKNNYLQTPLSVQLMMPAVYLAMGHPVYNEIGFEVDEFLDGAAHVTKKMWNHHIG